MLSVCKYHFNFEENAEQREWPEGEANDLKTSKPKINYGVIMIFLVSVIFVLDFIIQVNVLTI